jgi:uncharacterized membrane protein
MLMAKVRRNKHMNMKRYIQTFFGGALVITPFAITGYFVWWLASKLGALGSALLGNTRLVTVLEKVFPPDWLGK